MEIINNPSIERLLAFEKVSWPKDLRATKEDLQKRKDEFGIGIFLMVVGNTDVAQVTISPKKLPKKITSFEQMRDLPVDEKSMDLWFTNIAVKEDRRGEGYAKKMIKYILKWAWLQGYCDVHTGVTCHGYKERKEAGEVKDIEDYMEQKMNPALNLFPKALWKVIKNYWPEDEGSEGYGVVLKVHL